MKAKAIRLWREASHLFKTEVLSISVGLWMYARASPFSLALAMLVLTLNNLINLKSFEKLPRQFTWNELTSLKSFSPKFFRLIWAAFILTNPTFFYELFSQLTFLQKKSENQDEATASSCLMLATALLLNTKQTTKRSSFGQYALHAVQHWKTIETSQSRTR